MNKIVSIALFLTFITTKAQYRKIPFDTNHFWQKHTYRVIYVPLLGTNVEEKVTYNIKALRDTLISGKTYHIVNRTFRGVDVPNSLTGFDEGPVYFRQDTLAKKVWMLGSNNEDRLLYNFNKLVGDTMSIFSRLNNAIATYTINKIDSVLLNDDLYHRRFYYGATYPSVEGIGSLGSLTYPDFFKMPLIQRDEWVVCFNATKNGVSKIYGSSQRNVICYNTIGVAEHKNLSDDLNVYPNPANGKCKLEILNRNNFNALRIAIRNLLGQTLYIENLRNGSDYEINLTGFSPGVYFITLYGNGLPIGERKILVE